MCLWLYSIGNTLKVYILERHTDTPTITDMEGLLYRYLVRRTSGAEDREVYAWLEASEKNRSLFFEVAAVWSAHRTLISPATGERCDAMLRRLNARIDADDAMQRPARLAWRRWLSAAAAAAVVEIVVERDAEVKYSSVQNWYPGDKQGRGGIYNFVTKRGICRENARLSWTQVETGSAITWKYPSCILAGDNSVGEFYSVAMTNNFQQADTGTKMIHLGKNTKSTIVSKGISAGHSQNSYRGLVKVSARAEGARNHSQCDSLLLSSTCGAHTFPYADIQNETAIVEHEATTSKISEEQLFYCLQWCISVEEAVGLIVNGYAREVMNKLPMEFAVEAQKLLTISLEGSVG